jgi:hypothetical protein
MFEQLEKMCTFHLTRSGCRARVRLANGIGFATSQRCVEARRARQVTG